MNFLLQIMMRRFIVILVLSKDYIYDLRIIAQIFKRNEIIDSVPFSYYRALMRKKNQFDKYV
jgi:hypothetical protein